MQTTKVTARSKDGKRTVEFDVVLGPGVTELCAHYGMRRVGEILRMSIERMYREKATAMIRRGIHDDAIINDMRLDGGWQPPGDLQPTQAEIAFDAYSKLDTTGQTEFAGLIRDSKETEG